MSRSAVKEKPGQSVEGARSYREAMPVTECRTYKNSGTYPVCPRCNITLEREYQSYCDRCGQYLNWRGYLYPNQHKCGGK